MICVLLTWLVFASMINNLTMGSSPGLICTAVARQFKSWSDYHGSKSCQQNIQVMLSRLD